MIHTIKLDHVLRETVATPYRDLVTRPTGAAVRSSIEQAIAEADAATTLLDFSSVGLVDFSCADEVVAKLLLRVEPGSGHYLVLQGLREDHSEAIDHVLTHHSLAVLVVSPDQETPQVLGHLTSELQLALAAVHRLGQTTTARLADLLLWTVDRATTALTSLTSLRLVRESDGTYQSILTQ
jgi:hypothetical protein